MVNGALIGYSCGPANPPLGDPNNTNNPAANNPAVAYTRMEAQLNYSRLYEMIGKYYTGTA